MLWFPAPLWLGQMAAMILRDQAELNSIFFNQKSQLFAKSGFESFYHTADKKREQEAWDKNMWKADFVTSLILCCFMKTAAMLHL